jgi:DNA-binding GntR family transcriptional regulator
MREHMRHLQRLREQMQHVADAMQAGDADRAAQTCRTAVRLARPLLREPD